MSRLMMLAALGGVLLALAGCGAGRGFGCPEDVPAPKTGYCSYHPA